MEKTNRENEIINTDVLIGKLFQYNRSRTKYGIVLNVRDNNVLHDVFLLVFYNILENKTNGIYIRKNTIRKMIKNEKVHYFKMLT